MKLRVIFVDDEPNILRGLRRMLRSMRGEWDMVFAEGGEEALDIMKGDRFDAVVTDMRMPGINGAELLHRVREEHPHAVRFVLSGQSREDVIVRSVGCAHQFLSKPCEAEVLKKYINRTCQLLSRVGNERISVAISALDFFPLMPEAYRGLIEWLDGGQGGIKEVSRLISNDFSLASKVLQLTNSAFYGGYKKASGIKNAVQIIGQDSLRKILDEYREDLTAIKVEKGGESLLRHILDHCRVSSILAGRIMRSLSDDKGYHSSAAIAAGLHDMGIILMSQIYPQSYGKISDDLFARKASITELEDRELGVSHTEAGAALLGLWGFDRELVEAVLYHHEPSLSGIEEIAPLTAVHIASSIDNSWGGRPWSGSGKFLDEEYVGSLGLEGKIAAWKEMLMEIKEEGVPA